jgi:GGDEF domain-containing protein
MNYRKFETLVLVLGSTVVLVTILASLLKHSNTPELIGQALTLFVLFFALHYGLKAGLLSAIAAVAVYLASYGTYSEIALTQLVKLVILRLILFGIIGIGGGELAIKIKYLATKFDDSTYIDQQTKIFSYKYIQKLLTNKILEFQHHRTVFALLIVQIKVDNTLKKNEIVKLRANVATILRENTRLSDYVGTWQDKWSFCLIADGANKKRAHRIAQRIQQILSAKLADCLPECDPPTIAVTSYAYPEKFEPILSYLPDVDLNKIEARNDALNIKSKTAPIRPQQYLK